MPNREVPAPGVRRGIVITPNPRMLAELDPLLKTHLSGVETTRLRAYPPAHELAGAFKPDATNICLLDVATDRDQALQLMGEMARLSSTIQVVALLSGDDPDLILRCLRAGAVDFLIQPFTSDQIQGALGKLARHQPPADAGREPAKIYAVMPAKGACGATTIAYHLAFHFKRISDQRILLADLDPLAGTLSFLLKVKSIYSFLDALTRSDELDVDLWNSMVKQVNGVDVLLAPELLVEGGADLHDSSPILDFARHHYDVVIVDTGGVYGEWNLTQARLAQELLLITTNELLALQAAQRCLSYLDTNRIGRWKTRLIVNRYNRDVGLNRDVIGTALHTEVFDILPSDYDSVQKSLMEGKPAPSTTAFGKSVAHLAERLGGHAHHTKRSTTRSSFLGLFSKGQK